MVPSRPEILRAEPETPTDRPPLLFVHGLGHAAWCWESSWLGRAAEAGWPAHAISLPAHGATGPGKRRASVHLADYERVLVDEVSGLPRPPVVIAHSLGCVVTSRVAAVVPFSAIVLLTPVDVTQGLGLLVHTARRAPGHVARMAVGLPVRLTSADLFHGLDTSTAHHYVARLDPEPPLVQMQLLVRRPPAAPRGRPPVLVYGAEDDTLVPRSGVQRTARFYGVAPRWLPGIGHDVMLDAGNEQVLDQVLDDVQAALRRG